MKRFLHTTSFVLLMSFFVLVGCHKGPTEDELIAMGDKFFYGKEAFQDYTKAVRAYQQALEMGSGQAAWMLGQCYNKGLGVMRNPELSATYLTMAADKGHPMAQAQLGLCYDHGWGVSTNHKKAVELYKSAANRGNPIAMTRLGDAYMNGLGVEQDTSLAIDWYQKCVMIYQNQFDPAAPNIYTDNPRDIFNYACTNLKLHRNDMQAEGVARWFERAIRSLRLAHQRGDAECTYFLALCYEKGWGANIHLERAAELVREAADQAYPIAQIQMAMYFHKGIGVPQNDSISVVWLKRAARQNDSFAEYYLAQCYEQGRGVEQNDSLALVWYLKSVGSEKTQ